MQELVAAQARLDMTQKVYLPPTYYAPCGNQHQSPADVNTIATQACSKRPDQGGALGFFVAGKRNKKINKKKKKKKTEEKKRLCLLA